MSSLLVLLAVAGGLPQADLPKLKQATLPPRLSASERKTIIATVKARLACACPCGKTNCTCGCCEGAPCTCGTVPQWRPAPLPLVSAGPGWPTGMIFGGGARCAGGG